MSPFFQTKPRMATVYLDLLAKQNREAEQQQRENRKPKRESRDSRRRDMMLPERPEQDDSEDAA